MYLEVFEQYVERIELLSLPVKVGVIYCAGLFLRYVSFSCHIAELI